MKRPFKEYAYSIDIPKGYNQTETERIIKEIIDRTPQTEIHFNFEYKKANNVLHIHSLLITKNIRLFQQNVKTYIGNVSYKKKPIFDRQGWLNYMATDGGKKIIITNI